MENETLKIILASVFGGVILATFMFALWMGVKSIFHPFLVKNSRWYVRRYARKMVRFCESYGLSPQNTELMLSNGGLDENLVREELYKLLDKRRIEHEKGRNRRKNEKDERSESEETTRTTKSAGDSTRDDIRREERQVNNSTRRPKNSKLSSVSNSSRNKGCFE